MQTIQVVLDTKLLQAADRAAKRQKMNRSALIRDALREHLKRCKLPLWKPRTAAAMNLARNEWKNTACGRTPRRGRRIEPRRGSPVPAGSA